MQAPHLKVYYCSSYQKKDQIKNEKQEEVELVNPFTCSWKTPLFDFWMRQQIINKCLLKHMLKITAWGRRGAGKPITELEVINTESSTNAEQINKQAASGVNTWTRVWTNHYCASAGQCRNISTQNLEHALIQGHLPQTQTQLTTEQKSVCLFISEIAQEE